MKKTVLHQAALGGVLLTVACASAALTLGRGRGVAVLGQAFDYAVELRLDSADDATALCFEAEVFYGDTRVEASRVTTRLEPMSTSARDGRVRIRSTSLIDEPVVTVYLRVGCAQKSTRRYVLLADPQIEPATSATAPLAQAPSAAQAQAPTPAPVPATAPPLPPNQSPPGSRAQLAIGGATTAGSDPNATRAGANASAPRQASATNTAPAGTSAERRAQREAQRAQRREREQREAQEFAARREERRRERREQREQREAARVAAAQQSAGRSEKSTSKSASAGVSNGSNNANTVSEKARQKGPRLKLDPVDLSQPERSPNLRASIELRSTPDETQRALAAATWRSLNADAQEVLRDGQRQQALEGDLKSLRDLGTKNQTQVNELRLKLQQAEQARYHNPLVYALIALLLLALGVVAWLWRRSRGAIGHTPRFNNRRAWWQKRKRLAEPPDSDPRTRTSWLGTLSASTPAKPAPVEPDTTKRMELLLAQHEQSANATLAAQAELGPTTQSSSPAALPTGDPSGFSPSMLNAGRAVSVDELFDVQQQADFFESLGEPEQAIALLEAHISGNTETSALAYLGLLKIYHARKRTSDYERLRQDFNRIFNVQAPAYEAFSQESAGLQDYPKVLGRIEALWTSPQIFAQLESLIVRTPEAQEQEVFSLEAYRELLLLYAIARDVVTDGDTLMDFDFTQ